MKELSKFKRWANHHRSGRGLLCHFYTLEGKKQKQYYPKPDYAQSAGLLIEKKMIGSMNLSHLQIETNP